MGADTKLLRGRIKSVTSTLKLTKAMGLVASSKIRRATDAMMKGRQYANAVQAIVTLLTGCPECAKSPYLQPTDGERTRLIVIAGDRGLAGGYNANIFRELATLPNTEIIPIGKRACDRFGNGSASAETFSYEDAFLLSDRLCREFLNGDFDRLGILGTHYVSALSQEPTVTWLLPLSADTAPRAKSVVFEPNETEILSVAVPYYVAGVLMQNVRESFCCEVAARRAAMDSAGKNAQQMIDDLQLAYNRARQGAITQEITEIVAGSGS